MRLAVHLWNMARICKQMKKSIKSSSAKSPETQGHSLPEGLAEGSMKAGGLEPAKTGLRDRISPICTLSQNGYGNILVLRLDYRRCCCSHKVVVVKFRGLWLYAQYYSF